MDQELIVEFDFCLRPENMITSFCMERSRPLIFMSLIESSLSDDRVGEGEMN